VIRASEGGSEPVGGMAGFEMPSPAAPSSSAEQSEPGVGGHEKPAGF
jgi:hypothetical protein